MPRDETRTIKVRCTTWDQVESFYTHKLKADSLVVKMPVRPAIGEGMTVALGLPSGLVFAIDGSVVSVGASDAVGKCPVALKMHGLTKEVRERLARLVKDGREGLLSSSTAAPVAPVAPDGDVPPPDAPLAAGTSPASLRPRTKSVPPSADGSEPVVHDPEPRLEDVIVDERPAFQALAATHKRLTALPAHEVLGVPFDADLRAIRTGYFALARTHHPDAYGKYLSPALRRLACELFIHVNRAYDRMREAALRASGVSLPGPAARGDAGWVVELGDVEDVAVSPTPAPVELVVEEGWGPEPGTQPGGQVVPAAPPAAPAPSTVPGKASVASGTPTSTPVIDLASELFGDMPAEDTAPPFDAHVPASTESALSLANAGRAAMAGARYDEARANFAAALRLDGRNRPVRALYHVASGMVLRQKGDQAEATTQFETALGHDPQCADALRALGRLNDTQGIFKRVFDR